jgi:hypothetical protein
MAGTSPSSRRLPLDRERRAPLPDTWKVALWCTDGLYYAIGSHLTGWNANPNLYAHAKSLEGPGPRSRTSPRVEDVRSHRRCWQGVGTSDHRLFMGDIWRPRTQWDSRYLWMPLENRRRKARAPRAAAVDARHRHGGSGDQQAGARDGASSAARAAWCTRRGCGSSTAVDAAGESVVRRHRHRRSIR